MGVEMSYESLGGCDYRLYYTAYLDCNGAANQSILPPNIGNPYPSPMLTFTGIGCTLPAITPIWVVYDASEVTPICPGTVTSCAGSNQNGPQGVAAYRYYADVSFCGITCTAVNISWGSCCRNYSITSGASGAAMYTEMTIPLAFNNSSPRFVAPPIVYAPVGQTSIFQQPAFDKDGDSLVYSFAPCMSALGQPVPYNVGFSPAAPLGPNWNCSIDPQTGNIMITPNAGGVVIGVLNIQVDEYRNGTLIGSSNRDASIYMVNVFGGGVNVEPSATIINVSGVGFQNPPYYLRAEAGHNISFDVVVTDPDPGQLLAYTSNIANLFPTATLTTSGNTSPMTLAFSWTPDSSFRGKNLPLLIDVFDNFCVLNGHHYVFSNIEVDSNYIAAIVTPSDCTIPTGAIDVTVAGGFPPYTYSWNNGATTQDLVNIPDGPYILEVTDMSGTVWLTDTFFVNALGLSAVINPIAPDCSISNGSLAITASGGVSPYTYTWSNGMIGDSISNLALGGYSVNVYDALGCFYHTATMLNYDPADSCFSRIEGTVYYDFNNNCIQDPLEVGIANMYIDISPGGAVFTDANGHYAIIVPDTGYYSLQLIPFYNLTVSSNCLPPNFSFNVYMNLLGIDSLYNDFPVTFLPDIATYLSETVYVPGMPHYASIHCYNTSYYLSTATLIYQHDPMIINPTFSPAPANYNAPTYTATWNLTNFTPSSSAYFTISSTTSPNVSIGDTAKSYANILPIVGDITPYNNQDTVIKVVTGSYDPNFKEVSPQGQTLHGLIPPNTQNLEYTIHFQNTGTWPATFVIIRDTIDIAHLDITTTEIQMTSHNCITSVENDSILVFTFNNINLPDSFTNEPASHGFVKFGIKLKPNLPLYTAIHNTSAIYFDFNAPVITNTVTNTLYNAMNIAVTTNTNICPGDSVLATVAQGRLPYQFDWSNGVQVSGNTSGVSNIPANFTSGTQAVQVSDYYGATVSKSFVLNVYALADATFAYNPAGNTYYFTANSLNNVTYLWDFGNGQTSNTPSASATYLQSGTYTVTLICTDMCGAVDTTSQNITLSVGISPSLFQQQVSLSPNPSAGFALLSFENEAKEPYTLTLSDVNGKVIKSILNITAEKVSIYTNDMASGTYFWELKGSAIARGVLLVE